MPRQFFHIEVGLALAVALLASRAVSQNSSPSQVGVHEPLTLASAIQVAEKNYPSIRVATEQEAAAQDSIGIARTAYLPRADFLWQTNRATVNKPNFVPLPQGVVPIPSTPARATTGRSDWNTLTGVLLTWQPFDFGVRRAQVSAAGFGYESARQSTQLTRLDVLSSTAGAFLDVVAATQQVQVQQANVNRMEIFAKNVHVLVDNTLRPGADASQADAQLAFARTQLIQAQTQQQVKLETLANFLRIPADGIAVEDKQLLEGVPGTDFGPAPPQQHPAAERESAILNQQKQQFRLLARSYVPVFTLNGSLSGLGAGLNSASSPQFQGGAAGLAPSEFNWMTALQVTFPAMQIFTLHQQKKQQQSQVNSTQAAYDQLLGDISAQVREARAMLDGARRVAQNTPVELSAARQSEEQQQARYKSGLATVVDVSVAEAALAQAEGDDALARINVWRGLAGVAEAQGDLSPFLQLLNKQP